MKVKFVNMFLLGTLAMGSMMLGMTSCCDDDKENGNTGGGGGNTPVVSIKVDSVRMNKSATGMLVGGSEVLYCHIYPDNATNRKVKWSSDNVGVASVDSAGNVSGLSKGEANIKAVSDDGGKVASCKVTVSENAVPISDIKVSEITLDPSSGNIELVKGVDSLFKVAISPSDATNQFLNWSVDTAGIIGLSNLNEGVTNEMYVCAKDTGSVVLTISTTDGNNKSISCNIHVNDYVKVESIKIGRKSDKDAPIENKQDTSFRFITLTTDGKENPSGEKVFYLDTIEVLPANASRKKLHWSSSKESLAKLDTSGGKVKVSVKSWVGGIANIYAEAIDGSGVRDTFKVIVNHRKKVDCNRVDPATGEKIPTYAVQLWYDGPWWAEFNVGATIESYSEVDDAKWTKIISFKGQKVQDILSPAENDLFPYVGNYFSWGATGQYITYDDPNFCKDGDTLGLGKGDISGWLKLDNTVGDVARLKWGNNWCMPDNNALKGLAKKAYDTQKSTFIDPNPECRVDTCWCDGVVKKFSGSSIAGMCFIGIKGTDYECDTIFFPVAGYCFKDMKGVFLYNVGTYGNYWSSVPRTDISAWRLICKNSSISLGYDGRYYGRSVRAVCAK
ncbi:MAG TPA: hypothetical protein DDY68_02420 [Porphyromonadaceae bacterium]|nr:hypothetical protein [Porphyromonadaceae bacterium]